MILARFIFFGAHAQRRMAVASLYVYFQVRDAESSPRFPDARLPVGWHWVGVCNSASALFSTLTAFKGPAASLYETATTLRNIFWECQQLGFVHSYCLVTCDEKNTPVST